MSSFFIAETQVTSTLMATLAEQSDAAQGCLGTAIDSVHCQNRETEEPPETSPAIPIDPRAQIPALYDEYRPRLFRYLCSMHLSRETAEEVIQETFMRLTSALLKQVAIENVQGWIVRVARNLAIDTLKKNSSAAIGGEQVSFLLANRPDPALNPEEAYVNKEKVKQITMLLATLKPQHRECFQLRAHGFRYKTIGQAMGISEQRAALVVKQVAVRLAALCG